MCWFSPEIKKVYKIGDIDICMKKRVLMFALLLVLLVAVLTILRFVFVPSVSGNVIQEEINPVFSWREFSLKIVDISQEGNYLNVRYELQDFKGENQEISVRVYSGDSSNINEVVLGGSTKTFYVAKIRIPENSGSKIIVNVEASNGKTVLEDSSEYKIGSGKTQTSSLLDYFNSGNIYWLSIIALVFVIGFLIVRNNREYDSYLNNLRERHEKGRIKMDLG